MDRLKTTQAIDRLIDFAIAQSLIAAEDELFTRNQFLEIFEMDVPAQNYEKTTHVPETATAILRELGDCAVEAGLIEDSANQRDLFETKLMGIVTPHPQLVRQRFFHLMQEQGSAAATDWFYHICRACNYIRVDQIAKNQQFFADSPVGTLEITINLSKPEKDPRDIIAERNAPQVGYPKCMLCPENPGYAGRANFPARQNHRMLPLYLDGKLWHLQYSPYAYYNEHCIVLNHEHTPMVQDESTYRRLLDFVDRFPHYFIGANADLPVVGGSILSHDHFQGGKYRFPMDDAKVLSEFSTQSSEVKGAVIDWPMSCLRLTSSSRVDLIREAMRCLSGWREYSDYALDIHAYTGATPHNAITPILRKRGNVYALYLVLRNNRTDAEHPLGIFHPHNELHHIKKENIGLIEVMGLFILPGRLKDELKDIEKILTGELPASIASDAQSPLFKHAEWIDDLMAQVGIRQTAENANVLVKSVLADKCARVLRDAGVYKQDPQGQAGLWRFLDSVGYRKI